MLYVRLYPSSKTTLKETHIIENANCKGLRHQTTTGNITQKKKKNWNTDTPKEEQDSHFNKQLNLVLANIQLAN